MTEESQAARRARLFDHDWEQIHGDLKHQYTRAGDTAGAGRIGAALAGYLAMENRPATVSPLVAGLEVATEDLIAGMADVGLDADRLNSC